MNDYWSSTFFMKLKEEAMMKTADYELEQNSWNYSQRLTSVHCADDPFHQEHSPSKLSSSSHELELQWHLPPQFICITWTVSRLRNKDWLLSVSSSSHNVAENWRPPRFWGYGGDQTSVPAYLQPYSRINVCSSSSPLLDHLLNFGYKWTTVILATSWWRLMLCIC